jgi:hypothetical protein
MLYDTDVDWLDETFFDNHYGNTSDFHECLIYLSDFLRLFPERFSLVDIATILDIQPDRSRYLFEIIEKIGLIHFNEAGFPKLRKTKFDFNAAGNDFAVEAGDIEKLGLEKISSSNWFKNNKEFMKNPNSMRIQDFIKSKSEEISISEVSLNLDLNIMVVAKFAFCLTHRNEIFIEVIGKNGDVYLKRNI